MIRGKVFQIKYIGRYIKKSGVNFNYMKSLFLISVSILTFIFFDTRAQSENPLIYKYKSKMCSLSYTYIIQNDSVFIYGQLHENKTNNPVININILLQDFRIGTVPNLNGEFQLFLPRQEGVILFDKTGFTKFEFPFKYNKEEIRKPFTHHKID